MALPRPARACPPDLQRRWGRDDVLLAVEVVVRQLVGEKELRLRHDLPELEELLHPAAPQPEG